jgi:hypothetical protein
MNLPILSTQFIILLKYIIIILIIFLIIIFFPIHFSQSNNLIHDFYHHFIYGSYFSKFFFYRFFILSPRFSIKYWNFLHLTKSFSNHFFKLCDNLTRFYSFIGLFLLVTIFLSNFLLILKSRQLKINYG